MTSDQNSEVPTLQTYESFGNTENSVRSIDIAMADSAKNIEYTLQYRRNKREFVSIHAVAARKEGACNCSHS
jgi:hypothetical protein